MRLGYTYKPLWWEPSDDGSTSALMPRCHQRLLAGYPGQHRTHSLRRFAEQRSSSKQPPALDQRPAMLGSKLP
jgi:hypothetical protein